MSKKLEAAEKLKEAMSKLRTAMANAPEAEKSALAASMSEIRAFYRIVTAEDEATAAPAEDAAEDASMSGDELEEALAEELDLPTATLEDLGFSEDEGEDVLASDALELAAAALMESNDDDPLDEEIARVALELAASAISAEDEEAPVEDEPASDAGADDSDPMLDEPMDDVSDDGASPDDAGMSDDPMEGDELALQSFDDEDPAADVDTGIETDLDVEEILNSIAPLPESDDPDSDFDVPDLQTAVEGLESEDDDMGILTPEDLMLLEQEGLIGDANPETPEDMSEVIAPPAEDAPVTARTRAKAIASKRVKSSCSECGAECSGESCEECKLPPAEVDETDPDETLAFSEFAEVMASLSKDEVSELRASTVSAVKKMTMADQKKMERNAARNRRLRRRRGPVLRSKTGKQESVMLPGGKRKLIKKKFYFTTFDAKGNKLGQHWMSTKRPTKKALESYEQRNGVKHPFLLPVDPKAAKAAQERMRKRNTSK